MTTSGLRIGFVEPHLQRYGGIRRVVEFANRLTARGHDVRFVLPDDEPLRCGWMRCDAPILPMSVGIHERWDILIYNHEPQWHVLHRFTKARRTAFYALHVSRLYGKEGSWEALRTPVDAMFANSTWTADLIAEEIGVRPTVVLGGVNREMFSDWPGTKRYPVLCGGQEKWWKGTDTIRAACDQLRVPLESYAPKDLSQSALGREYAAAEIFVVGSLFEGFCQPGLEALACGVPLVTTDNGGCREYARDGETALVVPPGDVGAMADAIQRLAADSALAGRLAHNGLDLVHEHFDWERRTDEFEALLDGVVAGTVTSSPPPRAEAPAVPTLSIVVPAWNNLLLTQRFVETVRQHTDVPYELIIVDNGSESDAADYARQAADVAVCNAENLGFARAMNQGLELARGEWVAFCNNDTQLPERWASTLIETGAAHPDAGIVVPAITAANNPVNVRDEPGTEIVVIAAFDAPPAAVIYLLRADVVRELGGWGEEYEIASGEDVDLAFKVWVNDLEIVYDQRVLVHHISKGTASQLDDWQELWARNRRRFLEKWTGDDPGPRLDRCDPQRHRRNRATAAAVAGWMEKYFTLRDRRLPPVPVPAATRAKPASRPAAPAPPRRDARASAWLTTLATEAGTATSGETSGESDGSPRLWRDSHGQVVLRDGRWLRPVSSGLLCSALEEQFGSVTEVHNGALEGLVAGPPVEIFTAGRQEPCVVVGGQRLAVRGLPVPRRVHDRTLTDLLVGAPLDLAAASVRRRDLAAVLTLPLVPPRTHRFRRTARRVARRVARGARRRVRASGSRSSR